MEFVFGESGGGESALPASEYGFYGFIQSQTAYQQFQQQETETPQRGQSQPPQVIEPEFEEEIPYYTEEESSASGSALVPVAADSHHQPSLVVDTGQPYGDHHHSYQQLMPPAAPILSASTTRTIATAVDATAAVSTTSSSLSPMPSAPVTSPSAAAVTSTSPADAMSMNRPITALAPTIVPSNNNRRSSNSNSVSNSSTSASASASANANARRLERRGHTKSRRGCFNCKRRRIKCQETRPACGHCVKTGLQCEYPVAPLVNHQPQHQIPLFSLQDMRFFQHFLLQCSPAHPLGNKSLWTHEIPCLSHNYDYLMHALLGMAASELMQHDASLITAAMDHRLKSIRAIKRTLAAVPKWPNANYGGAGSNGDGDSRSGSPPGGAGPHIETSWCGDLSTVGAASPGTPMFEEGNALMATCFALTFQSVALDDGMAEYMTFIRGIVVVAIQMYLKGARILFRNILGNQQNELMRPALDPMDCIDRQWSQTAVAAIQQLALLCEGDNVAKTYHTLVLEMAEALLISPMEAYSAMTRHYAWWMQLPQEQFRKIIDLDRQVFVLLATHWIALKQIMARITSKEEMVSVTLSGEAAEWEEEKKKRLQPQQESDGSMDPGIIRWLKHLNRQVEPEYQRYNEWPKWVESELDRDLTAFGRE